MSAPQPPLQPAAAILGRTLGADVRLSGARLLKGETRSLVWRCRVEGGASVASVIIRQLRDDAATAYTDWASLAFLTHRARATGVAPRFYGGDSEVGVFVMEDLGEGTNLEALLDAGDAATVEVALLHLARQMARLHAATAGGEAAATFGALRRALPAAEGAGRKAEAARWLAAGDRLQAWLDALALAPPAGLAACREALAATFAAPGAFLAFTHGDPAPSNNHFRIGPDGRPEAAAILDFEYGAFRHALYDITAWTTLCPLPLPLVGAMREAFRRELLQSTVEKKLAEAAADEATFAVAWANLVAFRALAIVTWIPPAVLEENRPWAPGWSSREALLGALLRLQREAGAFAHLAPAVAYARTVSTALRRRWPAYDQDDLHPPWPALR
ncbi:MAG: hypothetical protein R3272_10985 [Candidatus Promineifilaceae bacterium]|nr:hypothetical protein [Candidatus Promineifilaceae bacterium]